MHAVEKPLLPPEIHVPATGVPNTGVLRNVGESFAVLAGVVQNHAKSTQRLDIEAHWSEPIDDVLQDTPSTLEGRAHVHDFQLLASEDACRIDRDDAPASGSQPPKHRVRHEFHDTKHRYVTYQATATTRFREYFPPAITDQRDLITHVGPEVELERAVVAPPGSAGRALRGAHVDVERADGARPHARRRKGAAAASTFLRTRTGGGLRVYMNRPWYSSGVDELLGVVLEDQPWITWPIDVEAGIQVSAVARGARRGVRDARLRRRGSRSRRARRARPPTERLLAGIARRRASVRAPRTRAQDDGGRGRARVASTPRCAVARPRDDRRSRATLRPRREVLPPERRPAEVRDALGTRPDLGRRRRAAPVRSSTSSRCGSRWVRTSRCSRRRATT